MVKLIENIQQGDLPTISDSFLPNPVWRTSDAFDYGQYYDKKKGLRSFQQARNKPSCKPDTNFKLDSNTKQFYNFTDYQTRNNISKYYRLIHPYCELNSHQPNIITTGTDIYNNTIAHEGIAGRISTTPIIPGQIPGQTYGLTPTTLNKIKGGIPYNNCVNFKYGFSKTINYSFRF
jgi:hypothetical protein